MAWRSEKFAQWEEQQVKKTYLERKCEEWKIKWKAQWFSFSLFLSLALSFFYHFFSLKPNGTVILLQIHGLFCFSFVLFFFLTEERRKEKRCSSHESPVCLIVRRKKKICTGAPCQPLQRHSGPRFYNHGVYDQILHEEEPEGPFKGPWGLSPGCWYACVCFSGRFLDICFVSCVCVCVCVCVWRCQVYNVCIQVWFEAGDGWLLGCGFVCVLCPSLWLKTALAYDRQGMSLGVENPVLHRQQVVIREQQVQIPSRDRQRQKGYTTS